MHVEADSITQKYFLHEELGSGAENKVYLAEHKLLSVRCAIKMPQENSISGSRLQKEAVLLGRLNHYGIPAIYDYIDDQDKECLVEEYVKGISLKDLRTKNQIISQEKLLGIFKEICNILSFLHNQKPYPILYLDLKPEHIMLTDASVKLIDFGSAVMKRDNQVEGRVQGTEGFSAPEQKTGKGIDERTDIYSVGAVFFWLLTGRTSKPDWQGEGLPRRPVHCSKEFWDIICNCMESEPDKRYPSVQKLLEQLPKKIITADRHHMRKSLTIAVMGSQPRVGTTHLAAAMTAYYNQNGYECIYEEKNETRALHNLYRHNKYLAESEGVYHLHGFAGIPRYGKSICIEDTDYEIVVRDYGTDLHNPEIRQADLKIIVLGSKEWEIDKSCEAVLAYEAEKDSCRFVLNRSGRNTTKYAQKMLSIQGFYLMPFFSDPFSIGSKESRFFSRLTEKIIGYDTRGGSVYEAISRRLDRSR